MSGCFHVGDFFALDSACCLWHIRATVTPRHNRVHHARSILKEISPEYSWAAPMLKLKLQYFGHLMQKADSLEKSLTLGKTEGRRMGQQRVKWLDGIIGSMGMSLSEL